MLCVILWEFNLLHKVGNVGQGTAWSCCEVLIYSSVIVGILFLSNLCCLASALSTVGCFLWLLLYGRGRHLFLSNVCCLASALSTVGCFLWLLLLGKGITSENQYSKCDLTMVVFWLPGKFFLMTGFTKLTSVLMIDMETRQQHCHVPGTAG